MRLLSLRYSADFRRSRLVKSFYSYKFKGKFREKLVGNKKWLSDLFSPFLAKCTLNVTFCYDFCKLVEQFIEIHSYRFQGSLIFDSSYKLSLSQLKRKFINLNVSIIGISLQIIIFGTSYHHLCINKTSLGLFVFDIARPIWYKRFFSVFQFFYYETAVFYKKCFGCLE